MLALGVGYSLRFYWDFEIYLLYLPRALVLVSFSLLIFIPDQLFLRDVSQWCLLLPINSELCQMSPKKPIILVYITFHNTFDKFLQEFVFWSFLKFYLTDIFYHLRYATWY